jgi:hypothetical protein
MAAISFKKKDEGHLYTSMLSIWDITNNNESRKTGYSYWIPRGYAPG